jgi:hypothetical protein
MHGKIKYYNHGDPRFTIFNGAMTLLRKKNFLGGLNYTDSIEPFSNRDPSDPTKYVVFLSIQNSQIESSDCVFELPSFAVHDVNTCKSILVLDYSHEAGTLKNIEVVEKNIERLGITNPRSIVLLLQNRKIQKLDTILKVFYFDFFPIVSFVDIYDIVNSDYNNVLDVMMKGNAARQNFVLCLNTTPRPHRLMTCAQLMKLGFLENSLISFPGEKNSKLFIDDWEVYFKQWAELGLSDLIPFAKQILSNAPYKVDNTGLDGNDLFNVIEPTHYLTTWMSVVTETAVGNDIARITEKAFKAFAMGHPTVVVGHPRTFDVVRDFGLTTYDEVFNERYDEDLCFSTRFTKLSKEIQIYIEKLQKRDRYTIEKSLEISKKNRDWIKKGFIEHYFKKYINPFFSYCKMILDSDSVFCEETKSFDICCQRNLMIEKVKKIESARKDQLEALDSTEDYSDASGRSIILQNTNSIATPSILRFNIRDYGKKLSMRHRFRPSVQQRARLTNQLSAFKVTLKASNALLSRREKVRCEDLAKIISLENEISRMIHEKKNILSDYVNLLRNFPARSCCRSNFNEDFYLSSNPDVRKAVNNKVFASGFHHWIMYGFCENRIFSFVNS